MTDMENQAPAAPRPFSLVLFLVLVLGGGLAIGFLTAPGAWYASLDKPSFNPPNWVFAPAWTLLYILIAIAGWRVCRRDCDDRPMRLWWIQLVLNFLWSPIFFAAHLPGLALAVIALLLVAILAFIATAWRQDRLAAVLFLPYAAWVAFATSLNTGIYVLN
ncbi:MAG: tryptophan-rich sensory protein [Azospirillaceae bacterium]|nr:tryptophan-rich sensory protein [Azospirillaceae bacterium]